MATYSVLTLPRAELDTTEHARTIALDSPSTALRWVEGLEAAIAGLAEMPLRFARIPEEGRFRREYRQFHHHSHRVIFFVDENAKLVVVARIVHGAKDRLRPDDLTA